MSERGERIRRLTAFEPHDAGERSESAA